jgi:hypothetical protein
MHSDKAASTELRELTPEEIEQVSGGLVAGLGGAVLGGATGYQFGKDIGAGRIGRAYWTGVGAAMGGMGASGS